MLRSLTTIPKCLRKHRFVRFHSTSTPTSKYARGVRPRRALLYMPVNNEKFVQKATTLDVDTLILDLEDAVAPNQKIYARKCAINALNNYTFQPRTEVSIRINPYSSGLAEDDIKSILSSNNMPHSVCLPKVQSPEEIKWLSSIITKEIGSNGDKIEIIGMIETPKAVLDAKNICTSDDRLTAIIFGGDDYAASINAIRTPSNHEISFARNATLLNAKSVDLDVIDIVNINFRDTGIFLTEANEGFELGFTGKQCIHPMQAELAQKAFSPPQDKINWSVKVVDAFNNQASQGIGAFDLDGEMIDMPTVKIAQNIVTRAKACGLL